MVIKIYRKYVKRYIEIWKEFPTQIYPIRQPSVERASCASAIITC